VFLVQAKSLFPSGLGSGNNVGGDISDRFVIQTSTERRHGVLSVGNLSDDSLFVSASSKVLLKGFLFKGLFGHDHVLSSSVASSAVGVEHLFTVSNIAGKGGLDCNSERNGSGSGGLTQRKQMGVHGEKMARFR
jgi:hypothetical protein